MYNRSTSYGRARTQPSTELSFTVPEEQTYDRDDHTNGALADHDANAHYAVDIDDYATGQPARTYNRSASFADHPPHTLVSQLRLSACLALPMPTCLIHTCGVA